MRNRSAPLQPAALAIAAGTAALALAVAASMGMGMGMIGAGPMMDGWMMRGYGHGPAGYHLGLAGGLFVLGWVFGAGALGGWILALVYNRLALSARDESVPGSAGPLSEPGDSQRPSVSPSPPSPR